MPKRKPNRRLPVVDNSNGKFKVIFNHGKRPAQPASVPKGAKFQAPDDRQHQPTLSDAEHAGEDLKRIPRVKPSKESQRAAELEKQPRPVQKATSLNQMHLQERWQAQKKITDRVQKALKAERNRHVKDIDNWQKEKGQLNADWTQQLKKAVKQAQIDAQKAEDKFKKADQHTKLLSQQNDAQKQRIREQLRDSMTLVNRLREVVPALQNVAELAAKRANWRSEASSCQLQLASFEHAQHAKLARLTRKKNYWFALRMRSQLAFSNIYKESFDLGEQARQVSRRRMNYNQISRRLVNYSGNHYTKRYKRTLRFHRKNCEKLNAMITKYNRRLTRFQRNRAQVFSTYKGRQIAHNFRRYRQKCFRVTQYASVKKTYWRTYLREIGKRVHALDVRLDAVVNAWKM